MKSFLYFFLIPVLLFSPLLAETPASEEVRMFLDFARFKYDETDTYLEIYYVLHPLQSEDANHAKEICLKFELRDSEADSIVAAEKLRVNIGEYEGTNGNSGIKGGLIKTVLPEGKFEVKMVRYTEGFETRVDSLKEEFATTPFKGKRITLSDLELCSDISKAGNSGRSLFTKNQLNVYPNPTRMFGEENPKLHYYIELYNLKGQFDSDKIDIQVALVNGQGKRVEVRSYSRPRNYESLVEIGEFDVSSLRTGLYTLYFAVTDPRSTYSVYRKTGFYILHPLNMDEESQEFITALSQSRYYGLSEDELDNLFAQCRYIATPQEVNIFKSLSNPETKRTFLFKFWRSRVQDNEDLEREYFSRVRFADENYGYINREGWRTDRGRVIIVYGRPDDIERQHSTLSEKPYEIWDYHELDGGAKFLFVDETGFGDYRLVSSTLRGEIQDPQWDKLLLEGTDSGGFRR